MSRETCGIKGGQFEGSCTKPPGHPGRMHHDTMTQESWPVADDYIASVVSGNDRAWLHVDCGTLNLGAWQPGTCACGHEALALNEVQRFWLLPDSGAAEEE